MAGVVVMVLFIIVLLICFSAGGELWGGEGAGAGLRGVGASRGRGHRSERGAGGRRGCSELGFEIAGRGGGEVAEGLERATGKRQGLWCTA